MGHAAPDDPRAGRPCCAPGRACVPASSPTTGSAAATRATRTPRAAHPGHRHPRPRLGSVHDDERHLGLQERRQQLEEHEGPDPEALRHRQQGRQLPAQRRPDRRGRDTAAEHRSAACRALDEGQRRGDLRHDGQPLRQARLGPVHQEGPRRRRDAVPARVRLAEGRSAAGAGAAQPRHVRGAASRRREPPNGADGRGRGGAPARRVARPGRRGGPSRDRRAARRRQSAAPGRRPTGR